MTANVYKRPSWDEYFIEITRTVARRSTCDRGHSGAVVVRDRRILSTGYVGSPPGLPHCDDVGHQVAQYLDEAGQVSQHCIRTIHAEQNAISQAARFGISLQDSTLYCKMEPCFVCARMIIAVGITRVVCEKRYQRGELTREMFKDADIQLDVLSGEVEHYDRQ